MVEGFLGADDVPEFIVAVKLFIGVSGFFQNSQSFVDFRGVKHLLRDVLGVFSDFRQIPEPEYLHFFLRESMRVEFGQFHKNEVQSVNHSVGVLFMNHTIVMVVFGNILFKYIVYQVQGIDGFQEVVALVTVQLTDISLGGVEHDTLHELLRPHHLHFYDKLAAVQVFASHVDDAVFA